MKIYQVLNLARAINNNEQVNKIILANLLNQDLSWIYANLDLSINEKLALDQYLNLVTKYASGFPLGYILGHVFFSAHKIFVDQNVLIPRDETELLVERALFYSEKLFSSKRLNVLDLCTGSGCIAISLALKKANWTISASDVSAKALNVAKKNQEFHHLSNINLIESDLFANLSEQKFDLIIANPPYIDRNSNTYNLINLQYEPDLALFANDFGLQYYQRIFDSIWNFTKKDFFIALEIGFDQKEAIESLLKAKFNNLFYWFEQDYSNHFRFLFIASRPL